MRLGTSTLLRTRSAITPRVVICDGDSITRGGGHVPLAGCYPAAASLFWLSPKWGTVNLGIDGTEFSGMLASQSQSVYPLIDSAKNDGKLVFSSCAGGTNDIGLAGTPPATLLQTAQTYFTNSKNRGAMTIGWTLLARSNFMTSVLTYNLLLRQSLVVDYLVDAGADVTIGNPTNVGNANVFADLSLHPGPYGTQVMANLFACAILSFGSRCSVTSVSPTSGSHAGGSQITIRGSGFAGAKAVIIGGLQSTSFSGSDSKIIATVPPAFGTFWPWPFLGDVAVLGPNGCGQLRNVWTWT